MPEDRKDRREKMAKEAKTNAMRMLDRQKVKYEAFSYECDEFIDGIHSADKIGAPYDQSFKTLVMEGKSGGYLGEGNVPDRHRKVDETPGVVHVLGPLDLDADVLTEGHHDG